MINLQTGCPEGDVKARVYPTLEQMIAVQAVRLADRAAVLAPGRKPLTFARLLEHIRKTRLRLWELGVGRGDIVANVLPTGSDAATASLCVSSCATVAALNPDLQQAEYQSLFEELTPKFVLAHPNQSQPARRAANTAGIPVIDVVAEDEAGAFTLAGETPNDKSARTGQLAEAADIAYIITTSGSTARPKMVPLSHRVLCSFVSNATDALALTPADRCLCFSPQFHTLGFLGAFLLPLGAGHSAVCTNDFQLDDFLRWMDEFQPTWFSAVPAILREILDHSSRHEGLIKRGSVRFMRAGGAPLPRVVAKKIEALFGAPLLQVYGLSEAVGIAMERFEGQRRRGSCGQLLCSEVMIVGSQGRPVPLGETGEVVVRGATVIDGYLHNPELTRTVFRDGWFHTGDIGYLDADNFLFLTGRASEFINRGGEKISPLEVDQALMTHPAVADAVTFSVPHDKLGEDIASAVVLHDGAAATSAELLKFASSRLAAHKLPRRIYFLNQLPVGPTGKVQRSKIWEYLSSRADDNRASQDVQPRNEMERRIARMFEQVLHRERVGIHDSFFDLGGDSLAATECVLLLEQEFDCSGLSAGMFLWAPSVAQLAELMADPSRLTGESDVLPFQPRGDGLPLFLIHPGHEGARFARHLGKDRPFFGIPIPAPADPSRQRSIDEMAAECTRVLRSFRPHGPYALVGWCAHGVVALEMARQLEQHGAQVSFVAMLDVRNFFLPPLSAPHLAWVRLWRRVRRFSYVARHWPRSLWKHVSEKVTGNTAPLPETTPALLRHRPQPWAGRIVHIWASDGLHGRYFEPSFGWNHLAPNGFVFHQVPGDHLTMIREPTVAEVARILAGELDRAQLAAQPPPASSSGASPASLADAAARVH